MPTIYDYANAQEIATYYKNKPSNAEPYLGRTLFPRQKQLGLDLSWIKGAQGLPVALTPSNFDADVTVRDRVGFEKIETEMPFFRESMKINEKDRQEINKLMAADNNDMIMTILENIFDDVTGLVEGAEVQAERMRMQLLSSFQIAIVANGVAYQYDYDPNSNLSDHQTTLTFDNRWSQTSTADPVSDISDAQDTVEEDTGTRPQRAVSTRATWKYLLNNDSILNDMDAKGYVGNTNANVNDRMLREYLLEELDLNVAVYNKNYSLTVKNQSANKFFPDDVFSLIPGQGTLGNTYYGTTPEESDLMTGQSDADVQIVDRGIAVTTKTISTPVNVETIVSGITLPSFERIDEVYILNVNG
jgi:hypothetical protein